MEIFSDLNVGDEFYTNYGNKLKVVFKSGCISCCEFNGELFLYDSSGIMLTHVNEVGFEDFQSFADKGNRND